jgi:hypothetical protein
MLEYLFIGIMIMFFLELMSPYQWTIFERSWIICLWPVALIIMILAFIKEMER